MNTWSSWKWQKTWGLYKLFWCDNIRQSITACDKICTV